MKTSITRLLTVLPFLILSFNSCNEKNANAPASRDLDGKETAAGNVKTGVKPQPDSQVVVIETADYGRIVIELYPNVPAEFSDIPYERGTVGAARTQDVNGANCQWFITLKKQPAFDKKYTVFGRVIDGIKNAEVIMGAPTEKGTPRPSDKIVIKSMRLQPRTNFP